MRKQKLEKFLNSVVKSHADVEEDKKEIENNVKRILELFENSADVSYQSDLVSLVNDIKKRCHSLYGHHDGLIGKIKSKVRRRKGVSRSGSSDSGSESSSDEDAPNNIHGHEMEQQISLQEYQSVQEKLNMMFVRNAELEAQNNAMLAKLEECQKLAHDVAERQTLLTRVESELRTLTESLKPLQAENEFLLLEIERSKEREGNLSLSLRGLQEENEVLMIEKQTNSSMHLETEETLKNLKIDLEMIIEETDKVRNENGFLREELDKAAREVVSLNQRLAVTFEEREYSRTVAENLKLENENLISENTRLLLENQSMNAQHESSTKHVSRLSDRLLIAEEENDNLKFEVLSFSTQVKEADKTIGDMSTQSGLLKEEISILHNKINEMNNQLKAKDDEKLGIAEKSSEDSKMLQLAEEKCLLLSAEMERKKNDNFLLLTGNDNLKLEVKCNNEELSNLRQALKVTESERNTLIEEKSALLGKVNEGISIHDELKAQIEQVEGEKSQMKLKINNLNLEFQAADLQLSDVKNAVLAAQEEKSALLAENSVIKSKLKKAELRIDSLQTEFGVLNEQNSALQSKVKEAEKDTNDFKSERNGVLADNIQLEIKVKALQAELKMTNDRMDQLEKLISSNDEQKANIMSEISMLTGKLTHAQSDNQTLERERDLLREENTDFQKNSNELHEKIVDYEKRLEDGVSEMQNLKDTLKLIQVEVLHEFQSMIDTSKGDVVEMVAQKDDLDQKIKELVHVSLENEVSLKKLEEGLRSKISDQVAVVEKYEDLLSKHKQLEDGFYEVVAKLDIAEKKLEEAVVKDQVIQKFETTSADQKNEIRRLNESYKEILEKFMLSEVAKTDVDKEMQRLEVQLRLSNQKLKITETEYKEKEEGFMKLVEGLQEELRLLDRQVLKWSGEFHALNSEYTQIKVVLDGLGISFNELQELESVSLENMKHTKMQLAECISELHEVKTWLESELHQKIKHQNEKDKQKVRLRYQQGVILDLKDEASRQGVELADKAKQLKILEMRVAELEKKLKEKEREVLDKNEEKREAIRQLCLLIEYHWENCNQLVRYLSLTHRSRRPS